MKEKMKEKKENKEKSRRKWRKNRRWRRRRCLYWNTVRGKDEAQEILEIFLANIIEKNGTGKSPQESLDESIQNCIKNLNELAVKKKVTSQTLIYCFKAEIIRTRFPYEILARRLFWKISWNEAEIEKVKLYFLIYDITGEFSAEANSFLQISFADGIFWRFFFNFKLKGNKIFYERSNDTDLITTNDSEVFTSQI